MSVTSISIDESKPKGQTMLNTPFPPVKATADTRAPFFLNSTSEAPDHLTIELTAMPFPHQCSNLLTQTLQYTS